MNKVVIKSEFFEEDNLKAKKIFLNQNLTINTEFEQLIKEINEAIENNIILELTSEKHATIDASFVQIIFSTLLLTKEKKKIKLNIDIEPHTLELIKNADLLKLIT